MTSPAAIMLATSGGSTRILDIRLLYLNATLCTRAVVRQARMRGAQVNAVIPERRFAGYEAACTIRRDPTLLAGRTIFQEILAVTMGAA